MNIFVRLRIAASLLVLSAVLASVRPRRHDRRGPGAAVPGVPDPIREAGLFGLENLATEQLARDGVHEFLFVLTYARTRGSTAAVVAPAAVYCDAGAAPE